MTIENLRGELQRRGIPKFAYNIGKDEDETYCLIEEPDGWHVFYSERGKRIDEQVFSSEVAACDELLQIVLKDGVVRQWMEEN